MGGETGFMLRNKSSEKAWITWIVFLCCSRGASCSLKNELKGETKFKFAIIVVMKVSFCSVC